MSTLFTDSGAGADANPIAGNWSKPSGFNAIKRLSNKFAAGTASSDCWGYVNSVVWPNDQPTRDLPIQAGAIACP